MTFRSIGLVCALLSLAAGCAAPHCACDRGDVARKVGQRTGVTFGSPGCPGEVIFPNGASLADGLTEDEAVVIALWNNAAFHELMADLDIANGDLVQAGLLPNPEVGYFFPVSEKPYKYVIDFPLEALWLRPIKVAAAGRETARVCERLTQAALDLIRDVRQAYADALLARGRIGVAQEAVRIRGQIASLADTRLKAGDISVQEGTTARIDSLAAQQEVARAGYDVSLADEKLRNLLGVGVDRTPLVLDASSPAPPRADLDAELLTAEAIANRPDALAADQAARAALERLQLARLNWVRFLGILDATSGRDTGHEFGPAFRVTLPLFNFNEGNIARAEGELTKAERLRQTIRNQIVLDVHQAHFRYTQARIENEFLDQKVRPEVEAAIRRAEAAYREGNTSYVVTLETTRQLLDSRLRQEVLRAELRRAWADLERSVGRRLDAGPPIEIPRGATGLTVPPADAAKPQP